MEWAIRPDALPFFERHALSTSRLANSTLSRRGSPRCSRFSERSQRNRIRQVSRSCWSGRQPHPDRTGACRSRAGARRDRGRGGCRTRRAALRSLLAEPARGRYGPRAGDAALRRRQAEARLPRSCCRRGRSSSACARSRTRSGSPPATVCSPGDRRPALEHEELESVTQGAGIAGVVALAMVSVVLIAGLGNWRLVLATLGTLLVGWPARRGSRPPPSARSTSFPSPSRCSTSASGSTTRSTSPCATASSCAGARRTARRSTPPRADTGASLVLCAVTTGLAFYAFVPTEFAGVLRTRDHLRHRHVREPCRDADGAAGDPDPHAAPATARRSLHGSVQGCTTRPRYAPLRRCTARP